jgi:hypothetical protein
VASAANGFGLRRLFDVTKYGGQSHFGAVRPFVGFLHLKPVLGLAAVVDKHLGVRLRGESVQFLQI